MSVKVPYGKRNTEDNLISLINHFVLVFVSCDVSSGLFSEFWAFQSDIKRLPYLTRINNNSLYDKIILVICRSMCFDIDLII